MNSLNISAAAPAVIAWLIPLCFLVLAVWLTAAVRRLKFRTASEGAVTEVYDAEGKAEHYGSAAAGPVKNTATILSLGTVAVLNIYSSSFHINISTILLTDLLLSVILIYIYKIVPKKNKNTPSGFIFIAKTAFKMSIVFGWILTVKFLGFAFSAEEGEILKFEMSAPRIDMLGGRISSLVFMTWIVMFFLIAGAVLIRIFVIPKFTENPGKFQNLLETAVEYTSKYTTERAGHDLGMNLGAYVFSAALLMAGAASLELFALRAPTSDLTMTFAFAIISFLLMNYYAVRHKGLGGRIRAMASPAPFIFPVRLVSDIIMPFSLACHLFGNMLGGMIVMELLHLSLGTASVGIQAFVGLYFNIFHPLIEIYIFIMLTLAFINEAVE